MIDGFSSSLPPYFYITYEETLQRKIKALDPHVSANAVLRRQYHELFQEAGREQNRLDALRDRVRALQVDDHGAE